MSVSTLIFPRIVGVLPFDVYLRLGQEKFTKVFSKGFAIETERLEGYVLKGIRQFYILKDDRKAYLNLTGSLLEEFGASGDFSQESAQHTLDQAAESILTEIFTTHDLSAETLRMTHTVVKSYVQLAKSSPSVLPKILVLARTKKEIYRHCIMTSIFSTLLMRALLPDDPNSWLSAGLAGFLHDVGMSQLSPDVEEHNMTMPNEVKRQIVNHSRFSAEMLDGTDVPPVVQNAIRMHHEYWDGTGYPRGMKGEEIPILARVVTLTEHFSSYVTGSENGIALTPQLAVLALRKSTKIDPFMLATFSKLLKIE
jgi:putative nucleotidyltransferase with HDIG domain